MIVAVSIASRVKGVSGGTGSRSERTGTTPLIPRRLLQVRTSLGLVARVPYLLIHFDLNESVITRVSESERWLRYRLQSVSSFSVGGTAD